LACCAGDVLAGYVLECAKAIAEKAAGNAWLSRTPAWHAVARNIGAPDRGPHCTGTFS
jgi:hypothetical protein